MKRRPYDATRLLKWYPASWRARYGDEFVAYVEDTLDGARPKLRFRFSIVVGALRERGRDTGLLGDSVTPSTQSRTGSLLVLCAWSVFILAGATFSKTSEHFARAMPAGSSSLARTGFDVVAVSGALGMVLVAVGAVVAVPTFISFVRSGGWTIVRQRFSIAIALTLLAIGAVVPLSLWAHHLTSLQRNGGDDVYSGAFVAWAILIALTIANWDRVAVACVSRMRFSPRVLRTEALLATAVWCVMVTITIGAAFWWVQIGSNAPWFLEGTKYGSSSSPLTPNLIVTLALMLVASSVGAFGVRRIAHSWRQSSASPRPAP